MSFERKSLALWTVQLFTVYLHSGDDKDQPQGISASFPSSYMLRPSLILLPPSVLPMRDVAYPSLYVWYYLLPQSLRCQIFHMAC